MATQNHTQKIVEKNIFSFLIHNSVDSPRLYGRLLETQKTGSSRELFLPENDCWTSSTKKFPKEHPDFGGLETNRRHEIQTWFLFTCSSTYESQYNVKLVLGT